MIMNLNGMALCIDLISKTQNLAPRIKDTKVHEVILGFLCETLSLSVLVANT